MKYRFTPSGAPFKTRPPGPASKTRPASNASLVASGLILLSLPALGQPFPMPPPGGISVTAPYGKGNASTQAKVTIAATNTFLQALAANPLRLGCLIQYTGTHVGYVFFGPTPADTTTSFQLTAGQSISCSTITGGVNNGPIQVTATSGDTFVVAEQ